MKGGGGASGMHLGGRVRSLGFGFAPKEGGEKCRFGWHRGALARSLVDTLGLT